MLPRGAAQARQALEKQQIAEQALTALDQKAQKDKTNALAENDKLRADVASFARRLRIAGGCNAGSGNLSGSSATTSLGDAGTVELSTAVGSTVLSIRAGIIADQAALKALQSYVMNVCR
ncbi:lysis system i-spanin subunit Rz [Pseudomonas chlororaphis]|uniref:lysis system i-spanin subunit Rz n=1 Tax=Pseudomonas chlororaphis TaxID=587753 RepID=UPI0023682B2C|nr:lysis system i-spanin subunit Rz [Pseudomonas chlororaphis]WDH37435.1 lysis system i-spanin subunit Rz [Pseudomonas chlororaphis]WDH43522.1 lysis system i-spanin subunit Rz [Pseudomonas chlororaphis]